MLLIYLAVYIIIILVIWGFYGVARMHSLKFRNFSTHIVPVTNGLLLWLILLTIFGFILIFFVIPEDSSSEIRTQNKDTSTQSNTKNNKVDKNQENLKNEIIGEEYY